MVDLVTPNPLSTKGPEHETQEEAIPLSEYKFDQTKFVAAKRTPKHKRSLIGGVEKALIEGYEKRTLWDISSLDVARIWVDNFVVIANMALAG